MIPKKSIKMRAIRSISRAIKMRPNQSIKMRAIRSISRAIKMRAFRTLKMRRFLYKLVLLVPVSGETS